MKVAISTILLCLSFVTVRAQFTEAKIGVNGLTCSQCTRNVEMRLRKLAFVKDVNMNLEHTEGTITFKEHSKVDINKIAKAVKDAGFSLRSLQAVFHFENQCVADNSCFSYEGDNYQFIAAPSKTLNGNTQLKFVGADYVSKKEIRSWQPKLKSVCGGNTYFVVMGG